MYNQTNVFKGGYGDNAEGGSDSYIDLSNYLTAAKADPVYINETGDTMRGNLDMGGYKVTNLALPTTSNDAVTKSYCDSIATQVSDSDYVVKLTIPANTSGGNMATAYDTFAYTAEVFAVTIRNYDYASSTRILTVWLNTLRTDNPGGTWSATTYVVLLRIKLLTSDITTVAISGSGINPYVEKYLSLTGGTLSGDLNIGTNNITALKDPTSAQHSATKNYVDKLYPNSTSFILGSNDTAQGNSGSSRAFSKVTEDSGTTATLYINNNGDFSGGVRIGSKVNMNSNIITNLANPVSSFDAATKSYVDTKVGGLSSSHIRYLDYSQIITDLAPTFWISPFFANGLKVTEGLGSRQLTTELTGNGCTIGTTMYTYTDTDGANNSIRLSAGSTTVSIISTASYLLAGYTFFLLAKRNVPASTLGRILTSSTGNKLVGWWGAYMKCAWHDEDIYGVSVASERTNADDKQHLFIYRVGNDYREIWDGDTSFYTGYKGANTDWGAVRLGGNNESADSDVYECLCFNRKLNDTEITSVKTIFKKYYKNINGDSFEDGYKFIFDKDLNRHVALRKYRRKVRERLLKVSNFDKKIVKNAINRFLEYTIILNTFKPKFWISAFYSNGIEAKTNTSMVLNTELTGNGFYSSKKDWSIQDSYFELTEGGNDYLKSTFEFGNSYTIIAIVKRLNPRSMKGRVITSSVGNKYVFYHSDQMRRCALDNGALHYAMIRKSKPCDDKMHLITYTCDDNVRNLYDGDKLVFSDEQPNTTVKFGNIVIGDIICHEGASAYVYECIAFDSKLSDESLDIIRYIFGKYMPLSQDLRPV